MCVWGGGRAMLLPTSDLPNILSVMVSALQQVAMRACNVLLTFLSHGLTHSQMVPPAG